MERTTLPSRRNCTWQEAQGGTALHKKRDMGQSSSQDAPPPPAQTRIPPPPRSVEQVYSEAIRSEDGPSLSGEIQRQMRDQITGFVEDPRDPQANFFRRHLMLHQNPPLLISRGTTLGELSRRNGESATPYLCKLGTRHKPAGISDATIQVDLDGGVADTRRFMSCA